MNRQHLESLSSPAWAQMLATNLLPWLSEVTELGDDVLEIGPGPGLTTDLLRQRAARVTAVEIDPALATALAERLRDTNVEVVHGDAGRTGLAGDRFSTATCFAVFHHVPSAELQDRVLAEVQRVLRPAGCFLGTDAVESPAIRQAHVDDVYVPVDPDTLGARLEAAGFTDVTVDVRDHAYRELRFHARKPRPTPA
jgi:SAM-dependent methyltransferase